ncbi:MAG TPA: hypothetical protein VJH95_00065 [Candidatus Nanoarchaeia archaeon]|nr:hypothetical protein [Candidatus Nanoarchaeia archaeon]
MAETSLYREATLQVRNLFYNTRGDLSPDIMGLVDRLEQQVGTQFHAMSLLAKFIVDSLGKVNLPWLHKYLQVAAYYIGEKTRADSNTNWYHASDDLAEKIVQAACSDQKILLDLQDLERLKLGFPLAA